MTESSFVLWILGAETTESSLVPRVPGAEMTESSLVPRALGAEMTGFSLSLRVLLMIAELVGTGRTGALPTFAIVTLPP